MDPAPSLNVSSTAQPPEAEQLRQIAVDIETYLGKWLVRTRRVIEHSRGSTTDDLTLSTQMKKFEETRHRWEARQQREMDDIAEQANELKSAWLKLESEQREFLRIKESWQRRSGSSAQVATFEPPAPQPPVPQPVTASEPPASVVVTAAATRTAPASASNAMRSGPPTAPRSPLSDNVTGARTGCTNTYDSAVRQFQQLRREVGVRQVPQ